MHDRYRPYSNAFGVTLLDLARSGGPIELVMDILKSDPTRDLVDADGNTALHLAVKNGHYQLIDLLLRYGFDPTIKNKDKLTPIAVAARPLNQHGNKWECVSLFLYYYKKLVKVPNPELYGLNDALAYAVMLDEMDMVQTLLKNGAKPIKVGLKNKDSCLHLAVRNDSPQMIKLLLKYGANYHALNNESGIKKTPLTLASSLAKKQGWECCRVLLDHEISKRHGVKPKDNFLTYMLKFNIAMDSYRQSMFIHNWKRVLHHERANSFLSKMNTLKNTKDVIKLLKFEIQLFKKNNDTPHKSYNAKYLAPPTNKTKDSFNEILEHALEMFQRLDIIESQKREQMQNGFREMASAVEMMPLSNPEEKYSKEEHKTNNPDGLFDEYDISDNPGLTFFKPNLTKSEVEVKASQNQSFVFKK